MFAPAGADPMDGELEKPFIPDQVTNEGFKKRLEKLTSGEQFRLDPSRATVKEDSSLNRRVESTMLTKFDKAELKALPQDSFPSVKPRERGPMLASLEVIQQLEYKATEKKFEENTFTNIDFGRDAVPETLEEAEEMFMGKWQELDTPAERERQHRLQVQKEKEEFARARQEALQGEKARAAKPAAELFGPELPLPTATTASGRGLPGSVKLVPKKKRPEGADRAAKRAKKEPETSSPAADQALGLVDY
eukprot:GGOE01002185.1.p2 GENE.GGOE01002185.1~~GGOE01002185.1.p2  ORF type:complete len:249 (-),score=108.59 GGOE01002185.1:269-1015(-)